MVSASSASVVTISPEALMANGRSRVTSDQISSLSSPSGSWPATWPTGAPATPSSTSKLWPAPITGAWLSSSSAGSTASLNDRLAALSESETFTITRHLSPAASAGAVPTR